MTRVLHYVLNTLFDGIAVKPVLVGHNRDYLIAELLMEFPQPARDLDGWTPFIRAMSLP
jgi:hypothetical protein